LRRVRGSRFGQKKNGGRTRRGRAASEGGKEDGRKGEENPRTAADSVRRKGRDEKRERGREVRTRSRTRERILLTVREERAPARVGGPANITPVLYF